MAIRLISLFLIVSIIYPCAPKPKSYESATKWYSNCLHIPFKYSRYPYASPLFSSPYPEYHPGDYIIVEDEFGNAFKEAGCASECRKKYVCSEGIGYASCVQNTNSCINSCYEEILIAHSVAYHIEDGYYSDGSYYAGCQPFYFTNIHRSGDKYKKTKWQTDRDECMKLTSENVKPSYWSKKGSLFYNKFFERRNGYIFT